MKPEFRNFCMEVRASQEGVLSGHLLRWDTISEDLGWFKEKFIRGAFAESIASRAHDILALWSHDWGKPLASRDGGSLTIAEDDTGPVFEFTPNRTSWGKDALEAVNSRSARGMSFGFVTIDASWETVNGEEIRTVTKADLYEISPVAAPAYTSSHVEARSVEDVWKQHLAEAGAASQQDRGKAERHVRYLLALNRTKERSLIS